MYSPIRNLRPKLLNDGSISSRFSLRNAENIHEEREIQGLNLGLNTNESEAIVIKNRAIWLRSIQVDPTQVAYAVQVHKTEVKEVIKAGVYEHTDAFVTVQQNLALAIQVADCAAVLFGDSVNKVIGAAHAGWRGAVGEIVPKTLRKMTKLGAQLSKISVFISPCISMQNFEVGEEVAKLFPERFVNRSDFNKPHVDLQGFIRHQLLLEGIDPHHIEIEESCTLINPNFYSYRRQKEKSGRMMGIIKLN